MMMGTDPKKKAEHYAHLFFPLTTIIGYFNASKGIRIPVAVVLSNLAVISHSHCSAHDRALQPRELPPVQDHQLVERHG
jgi:hypothetical protein